MFSSVNQLRDFGLFNAILRSTKGMRIETHNLRPTLLNVSRIGKTPVLHELVRNAKEVDEDVNKIFLRELVSLILPGQVFVTDEDDLDLPAVPNSAKTCAESQYSCCGRMARRRSTGC
ncbi:unnamed protein product, partial [Nesidiocoris tenuis]